MNFMTSVFNKDSEILQNVLINIAKYSTGDLIITDDKFNIVFHNLKTVYKGKKLSLYDITSNFLNNNIRINIENFRNSQKNHLFLKLIFNDNNIQNIPMEVHICKIRNKRNKVTGYYVILQDITQEITNKIQKETFIDILSHDLKTPIRANIQILELILNNKFGKLDSNIKSILDEVLNSCRFMNYMTDNLLIKYKNEFNMYELQKQNYSIVKLIKERCEKLMNLLDRKKQTIELIVKGNVKDIEIDVNEIGKVVNSLIINASEQSSVNSKIVIKIENNKDNIDVSFTDYGHGESLGKLNDIFEEYVACSNKFRRVGFSLELYNCRKIVEAHNGIISAKNAQHNGTEITFSLPLK